MIPELQLKRCRVSTAPDRSSDGAMEQQSLIVVVVATLGFQRSQEEVEHPGEPGQTQNRQNPGALFKSRSLVRSRDNPDGQQPDGEDGDATDYGETKGNQWQ